jgi:hypothetical protein
VILLPSTDDMLALPTWTQGRPVLQSTDCILPVASVSLKPKWPAPVIQSDLQPECIAEREIFVCCGLAELDSRFTAQREVSRPQPARRMQAGMESTIRNAVSNNSNRKTEMKLCIVFLCIFRHDVYIRRVITAVFVVSLTNQQPAKKRKSHQITCSKSVTNAGN